MKTKYGFLVWACFLLLPVLGAQSAATPTPSPQAGKTAGGANLPAATSAGTALPGPAASASQASPGPSPVPLQRGFEELVLGMSWDQAYQALKASTSLDYRGKPDVSLSPGKEEKIIETRGGMFIRRGIFQFRDQKLFSITLEFEAAQLDYYLLFQKLSAKYGEPVSLDPVQTIWEDSQTRLVLEKPQTLKYIDLGVFNRIIQQNQVEKTIREEIRESFINGL